MVDKLENSPLNLQATSVYNFNEFSLTELLNKFFTTINECVDSSNISLQFLTWLKGEGLPQETIKELNKMYNDGRITQAIDNLSGNLNNKIVETKEDINKQIENNKIEINTEISNINTQLEQIAKYITPEMFGAKGDGITDDTNSIQEAVNSNISNYILLGKKYLTTKTITVPEGKKLLGGVIYPTNTNIVFTVYSNTNIEKMIIDYSKMSNPPTNEAGYYGVYFQGVTENIALKDIEIKNFYTTSTNSFYGICSLHNTFNLKINGISVKNINVKGNEVVGDTQGSVRGIYLGHNNYLSTETDKLIRTGLITNCYFENINNIDTQGNTVLEDCDGIYLSGYSSDKLLPIAKSNVIISNCNFKNTGKRAIKLQTSGVTIENITIDLDLVGDTVTAIMGYGYNLTIKNIKVKGARRFFEGLAINSYFENITSDCLWGFYLYSTNNSLFNKIELTNSIFPFYLNPTNGTIYDNYNTINVENSNLTYQCGLFGGSYYTELNVIDGYFNFRNNTFILVDGQYDIAYLRNVNIENCTYINKRTTDIAGLTFNYLYLGKNKIANCDLISETSVFPEFVTNRKENTEIVLENIKSNNNYNGYFVYCAGNITDNLMIRNCNLNNFTSTNPIFINLTENSTSSKIIKIENVTLAETSMMRIGETLESSSLNIFITNVNINNLNTIDKNKYIATIVNKAHRIYTENIFNGIYNASSITEILSNGLNGLLYDISKVPYKLSLVGEVLTRVNL